MDLLPLFERINQAHFDGFLEPPKLRWNSRLRSSAGRFIGGRRRFLTEVPPVIEIATYLKEEKDAEALIADTLAHEMIHYWLWVRRRPHGHTAEFLAKMRLMGVSRYNSVPRTRAAKYAYRCPACETEFLAKRKLGILACAKCCKQHAGGRYDHRFRLALHRTLGVLLLAGFLGSGCASAPKGREKIRTYCGNKVCAIREETDTSIDFSVSSELEQEFTFTLRIETANPARTTWPKPQKDFVLKGPFKSTRLVSLPLTPGKDPLYQWRFWWKTGRPGAVHDPRARYRLPFERGRTSRVSQSYEGAFSHYDGDAYSIDFLMPRGTLVLAARDGVVDSLEDSNGEGGADPSYSLRWNYVGIRHTDGTLALYGHLLKESAKVKVGQAVTAGEPIALSGNSGYSTEPHLHFQVEHLLNGKRTESIPVTFASPKRADFVPAYGEEVTSE